MKTNKKSGIILALIIVLVLIVVAIVYLYSKRDISTKNTVVSGEENSINVKNADEQIKLITDNFDMWSLKTEDDMYEQYSYVVTDLDQNGRLEIITSNCQGTGLYTYSKYYEVNENYDGLVEIKRDLEEGSSEADIDVKNVKVYIDKDKNEYHYIFSDLIRNGATEYYENKQDIVLKDGKLSENVLAYKNTIYKDEVPEVTYQDTELKDITEAEYEKIEEEKFKGLECKNVTLGWITRLDDDLDNVTTEMSSLLTKSYDNFKFEDVTASEEEIKNNEIRHEAYKNALKDIMTSQKLPTDEDIEVYYDETMNMADNKFAIFDVDNDGHDELIIEWGAAPTAGQFSFIYDYDVEEKKFINEFNDIPLLTFYDNGVIVSLLSHNQGLAGDNFWPYFLYKYDETSDTYKQIAMVDAWDKSYSPTNYPEDVDKNKDGIVYYIITDGDFENKTPISKEDYENWESSYLKGANKLEIEFVGFTSENIENIK